MIDATDHQTNLPRWQQKIRARCFHPTGTFIPFSAEDVEKSVADRFETIVDQYADRVAIKTRHHRLTFNELNHLANRVAHTIIDVHGKNNEPIALLFDKGAPLIATFLAALKAGKIYVPCESWFPKERIHSMLADVQADLIVTDNEHLSLANELSDGKRQVLNIDDIAPSVSKENPNLSLSPDTLAYVLYTSGSLGQPKGVIHNHRNILHQSMKVINSIHLCPDDRMTLLASLSTSQACADLYLGLLSGAALYPLDIKTEGLSYLAAWIVENRLTYYRSSASVFRYFIGNLTGDEDLSSVRLVKLGGEAVQRGDLELYQKHFPNTCVFVNALSSTEARVLRTFFADKNTRLENEFVPAGYAVLDTNVVVLNDEGEEVEFDAVGEIAVKSRYLAVGYWRQPEKTQEAFVPDTANTEMRLFRTGDLGRLESDGCLVRVGRKDGQVKIRGYRVEPTEIEKVLCEHENVKAAVVVSRQYGQGELCLVAYVILTQSDLERVAQLKRFIASKLPDYMTPSAIMTMDQLPLTPSGKVDRRALPEPSHRQFRHDEMYVAPRTPIEQELAEIWAEVLAVDRVGMNDSFIELGGNSLVATRLISRVRDRLHVSMALGELLEAATVCEMAIVVVEHLATSVGHDEVTRIIDNVRTENL